MRAEEKVLKQIYKLVKGDSSPVHLPVSPETVGEATNLPLDRVLSSCRVLESHGFLVSSQGLWGPRYYYITTAGVAEALKPSLALYIHSSSSHSTENSRRRA